MSIYEKVLERVKTNIGSIQAQIHAISLSLPEIQSFISAETRSEHSREQKEFGAFYTPPPIAQYFLRHTLHKDFTAVRLLFLTALRIHDYQAATKIIEKWRQVKILDPACGGGIFLCHALRCLYENWLTLQNDWKSHIPIPREIRASWDPSKKKACKFLQTTLMIPAYTPHRLLTSIILNQLYGVDTNREAIIETQVNLWMEAARLAPESFLLRPSDTLADHLQLPDISLNFICGDAIFTLPNIIVLPKLEALGAPVLSQLIHLRDEYITQCLTLDKIPSLSQITLLQADLRSKISNEVEKDPKDKEFLEMAQGGARDSPIWWGIQFAHIFFSVTGQVLSEKTCGFSYIVGNPPYIHQKGLKNTPKIGVEQRAFFRHYYQTADSSDLLTHGGVKMNSFTLFLEQGVLLLRPEGTVAFLLHKNFLAVESYQKSRKFLLDQTQILEIVDMGTHIFPHITGEIIFIIAKKNKLPIGADSPASSHRIHIIPSIQASTTYEIVPKSTHLTPQNWFRSPPNYIFQLHLSPENVKIRDLIAQNSHPLQQYAEISSHGLNVKPQFISPTPQEGWVPAIRGKHIGRYLIKTPLWIYYSPESLTRPGNVQAFTAPEKLVMQRIGGNFAAAYDDQQRYVFNSVNMILLRSSSSLSHSSLSPSASPPEPVVSLKYLLAIINSTVIRFYIQKFFTMDAAFTINITKGFLETLPIPVCPPSVHDQIIQLVTSIEKTQQNLANMANMDNPLSTPDLSHLRHDIHKCEEALDSLIFTLYGLNSSQIAAVRSKVR